MSSHYPPRRGNEIRRVEMAQNQEEHMTPTLAAPDQKAALNEQIKQQETELERLSGELGNAAWNRHAGLVESLNDRIRQGEDRLRTLRAKLAALPARVRAARATEAAGSVDRAELYTWNAEFLRRRAPVVRLEQELASARAHLDAIRDGRDRVLINRLPAGRYEPMSGVRNEGGNDSEAILAEAEKFEQLAAEERRPTRRKRNG